MLCETAHYMSWGARIRLFAFVLAASVCTAQDGAPVMRTETVDVAEEAVQKGIAFLITQQKEDGSIRDRENATTMTSLAIMAMLSAGHLPADDSSEGAVLRKAIAYVLRDNSQDENVFATVHDQHVDFGAGAPFAVVGKVPYQQNTKAFWGTTESATITPINPQFLVVGSTGIAWGYCSMALKPKDGPMGMHFVRYTFTYAKSGGKWLSVASHVSWIP